MLEIGTVLNIRWWDEKRQNYRRDPLTIGGYVYHCGNSLYYVCVAEDGTELDIHPIDIREDNDED